MSCALEKQSSGFLKRSDTNRPVQLQKMTRSLKFRIYVEEGLYYLCSKNKGANHLCSYCTADLHLCIRLSILLVFLCSGSLIVLL